MDLDLNLDMNRDMNMKMNMNRNVNMTFNKSMNMNMNTNMHNYMNTKNEQAHVHVIVLHQQVNIVNVHIGEHLHIHGLHVYT